MKYIKIFLGIIAITTLLTPNKLYSQKSTGTIIGTVSDENTHMALSYSQVYIIELEIGKAANQLGHFEFKNIEPGTYTMRVTRVGYAEFSIKVTVKPGEATRVKLKMEPAVLNLNELTVTAEKAFEGSEIEGVSKSLSGSNLRKHMSTTLAATLQNVPGLSSRSMGAAPARPVLRGLGGKRVIILQDGIRTGDASAMSADHAVTVDPIGAEKIEIARGPEALKFGSNAVGGVINVVNNQILASMPGHIQGSASLQGATVNYGSVASLGLQMPVGPFAMQIDGNFRQATNLNTPDGEISNTGILSTDNTVGISYIQPWGYAGGSFTYYLNHYGIPPETQGELGVDIKMSSYQYKGKSEILFDNDFLHRVKIDLSHSNYDHKEIEPTGSVGTEFGLLSSTAEASLNHGELGFIDEGTFGVWGEKKMLDIRGEETLSTDSYRFASYIIETARFNAFTLKGGLRFDYAMRKPVTVNPNSSINGIRNRTYAAFSGSGSAEYSFSEQLSTGTVLFYSFRAPSPLELYAEGPHLASYSYEIGNPGLNPERALNKEIYVEFKSSSAQAKVSIYHNAFSNYIFPKKTGNQIDRLDVYQYSGGQAQFLGFETSLNFRLSKHFQATGSLSYTLARLKVDLENKNEYGKWRPLPKIPPLQSSLGLDYSNNGFQAGATARFAAKQTRTGLFESSTPGYAIFDLFGQYQFRTGHTLHTISLKAENLFDEIYRNHLSRIKEIMPEPGRNISLLYRVYF